MEDDTDTATIADFLLARVADDAREAERAASFTPWDRTFRRDNYGNLTVQPTRVVADCEAKRRIVEGHSSLHVCANLTNDGQTDYSATDEADGFEPCPTLRALAAVYSDHPDYRPEWRP